MIPPPPRCPYCSLHPGLHCIEKTFNLSGCHLTFFINYRFSVYHAHYDTQQLFGQDYMTCEQTNLEIQHGDIEYLVLIYRNLYKEEIIPFYSRGDITMPVVLIKQNHSRNH